MNGSNISERFELFANGSRALLTRDVAAITMDLNGVEQVTLNTLGGTDFVTLHTMNGTDVAGVTVNLAGTIGGSTGDGAVDTVTLDGTGGNDTITASELAGVVTIAGPVPAVTLNQIEFDGCHRHQHGGWQ